MREFFRGWRRKIGAVTLVTALLLMIGWIRSQSFCDTIIFYRSNACSFLMSSNGSFGWMDHRGLDTSRLKSIPFPEWRMLLLRHGHPSPDEDATITWRLRYLGFGAGRQIKMGNHEAIIVLIPYWFMVIPMTLISLWLLLLSKPHKSTQKRITESVRAEGA